MVHRVAIVVAILPFVGIGLWCAIDPVGALVDAHVTATAPAGEVELRAMYGGLQLGVACWLALQLRTEGAARAAIPFVGWSIGGMGVVRTVAYAAFQPAGALMPFLCAVELSAPVIAWAVLRWGARGSSGDDPAERLR